MFNMYDIYLILAYAIHLFCTYFRNENVNSKLSVRRKCSFYLNTSDSKSVLVNEKRLKIHVRKDSGFRE